MALKVGTVALVVDRAGSIPILKAVLSDEAEIFMLESALQSEELDPLSVVQSWRSRKHHEDEAFGEYVEDLLSKPTLQREVQEQAIQWLKSRIKLETFQKTEKEATAVIAEYAFRIYCAEPEKKDFFLSGVHASVRIRIFETTQALVA